MRGRRKVGRMRWGEMINLVNQDIKRQLVGFPSVRALLAAASTSLHCHQSHTPYFFLFFLFNSFKCQLHLWWESERYKRFHFQSLLFATIQISMSFSLLFSQFITVNHLLIIIHIFSICMVFHLFFYYLQLD